jgi:hypothetical protein
VRLIEKAVLVITPDRYCSALFDEAHRLAAEPVLVDDVAKANQYVDVPQAIESSGKGAWVAVDV